MPPLHFFLIVGLGGALGAALRYYVQNLGCFDENPYYYTVAINISGCAIIGILYAIFNAIGAPDWLRLLILTGCLGGYTTYSAFALDFTLLIDKSQWIEALKYISLTVVGGLFACGATYWLCRKICNAIIGGQ